MKFMYVLNHCIVELLKAINLNGKPFRESSGSTTKMVAKKLLDLREGEIAQGKVPGVVFERVTFDELADDFLRDYRINQKKSLARAERSVAKLRQQFGGLKAPSIDTPLIKRYIEFRLNEKAANATINRELAALKRLFNLAAEQTPPRVQHVPKIPMLRENNVRKGFFEHDEFIAVRNRLPEYLYGFVTFVYKTGWRVSEIAAVRWSQVDRSLGVVRLEAGETKNSQARTVYLDEELKAVFEVQWSKRKSRERLSPYVFQNRQGDDRVKHFYKSWRTACAKAKIGPRLFHDLRRTAVRNMVRSGIPETVAMKISGHKTRSVFDRYNITSEADLIAAAKKHEIYLASRLGTNLGTIHPIDEKRAKADEH